MSLGAASPLLLPSNRFYWHKQAAWLLLLPVSPVVKLGSHITKCSWETGNAEEGMPFLHPTHWPWCAVRTGNYSLILMPLTEQITQEVRAATRMAAGLSSKP